MARIDPSHFFRNVGIALVTTSVLIAGEGRAAADPKCLEMFKRDRVRILERFGKLQNYKTYTPQKAAQLHKQIERYLLAIGNVLENFNVETFVRAELDRIDAIRGLSRSERETLRAVLQPAFDRRRLPAYRHFVADLRAAGLGRLPPRKILDAMDRSFKVWRTKIIFDQVDKTGRTTYNKLARAFANQDEFGELSMQVSLLGKNEWEAFFEAEKGKGIFNPDMPGVMTDTITSVGVHEAVHMIVESLAARGHDSPYAVWLKLEKRLRKVGAIGERQKRALREAIDPLSDGDYYRNELYLDELPAHVIQAAFLNVQLSKALRERFQGAIDSVRKIEIKEELEDAFADYLRDGAVEWDGYAAQTKRVFEDFLATKASDGRTKIDKLLTEMNEYMNWVDLINDGGSSAVDEARAVLLQAIENARKAGRKGVRPEVDGPIAIEPDVFLGEKGYKVRIMVPVEVLGKNGKYKRQEAGAAVNFRFTNDGEISESVTPRKIEKILARMDWIDDLAAKTRANVEEYADFIDEKNELKEYTFADVFKMKSIHTRIRRDMRETLERIRASKPK